MENMGTSPHIVCLEECHCPIPKFPFPHTYRGYTSSTREDVATRLQNADIAITTIIPITCEVLDQCPRLKCVYAMATGTEWVDLEGFRKRGVTVVRAPQSNVDAVSEHAIALYFASRRKIVEMHNRCMSTDEYAEQGTLTHHFPAPPPSCSSETLAIIGYGFLGKKVEKLARALGMTVVIADRKGSQDLREGRVDFETALKRASVAIVTIAKTRDTIDLIDEKELRMMRSDAILINVSRGGIINEKALISALRQGEIGGAATDVFGKEPPARNTSLLCEDIPNLTVSPHLAWFSGQTIQNLQDLLVRGLDAYVRGSPINTV
jgi:glycerate dehydrogenase